MDNLVDAIKQSASDIRLNAFGRQKDNTSEDACYRFTSYNEDAVNFPLTLLSITGQSREA